MNENWFIYNNEKCQNASAKMQSSYNRIQTNQLVILRAPLKLGMDIHHSQLGTKALKYGWR